MMRSQPIPVSRLVQAAPPGPWVRWWPRFPVATNLDALRAEGYAARQFHRGHVKTCGTG